MKIKHFNDVLALVLVFLIVALWILQGLGKISAMPEVSGATIAAFTLIIQYYFRKSPPTTPTPPSSPPGGTGP